MHREKELRTLKSKGVCWSLRREQGFDLKKIKMSGLDKMGNSKHHRVCSESADSRGTLSFDFQVLETQGRVPKLLSFRGKNCKSAACERRTSHLMPGGCPINSAYAGNRGSGCPRAEFQVFSSAQEPNRKHQIMPARGQPRSGPARQVSAGPERHLQLGRERCARGVRRRQAAVMQGAIHSTEAHCSPQKSRCHLHQVVGLARCGSQDPPAAVHVVALQQRDHT